MNNILIELDEKAVELNGLVNSIESYLVKTSLSKGIRSELLSFYQSINRYREAMEREEFDKIAIAAKAMATYGILIAQEWLVKEDQNINKPIKRVFLDLLQKSKDYQSYIENIFLEYKLSDTKKLRKKTSGTDAIGNDRVTKEKVSPYLKHDQDIKRRLKKNDLDIQKLTSCIREINDDMEKELKKISALYEDTVVILKRKEEEINDILGLVSTNAIVGDFETSAAEEKKMANFLRYASLVCMVIIIGVVSYSFWETTTSDFQWQNLVFRMILAVMLSVPAAYLARESAKHREQQYSHLQTSLNLKAITPYIASLPDDEQHKIKVEVASRLFGARDYSTTDANPYPVSFHEAIMEIIKKLEIPQQGSKS